MSDSDGESYGNAGGDWYSSDGDYGGRGYSFGGGYGGGGGYFSEGYSSGGYCSEGGYSDYSSTVDDIDGELLSGKTDQDDDGEDFSEEDYVGEYETDVEDEEEEDGGYVNPSSGSCRCQYSGGSLRRLIEKYHEEDDGYAFSSDGDGDSIFGYDEEYCGYSSENQIDDYIDGLSFGDPDDY